MGQGKVVEKTIIIDTITPVIDSVEIESQEELLTNGGSANTNTLTPYIDINYTETNIASAKVEITTIDGQPVVTLEKDTSNDDHVKFTSNDIEDEQDQPILVNGGNYIAVITVTDQTGKVSEPFLAYLTITEGKMPHDLTISKIEMDNDGVDFIYYDNNYILDWSCSTLTTGESFQVSMSTDPNGDFISVTDTDESDKDKTAKVGEANFMVNADNPQVYLRVNVINADGSPSIASNTVFIKSITLNSTQVNQINYPANDERLLHKLAEEIQYSNLENGDYYGQNVDILDLISVTHVPTNKTYQMTYVDEWYEDSTSGMPEVLLNDQLNIIVPKNINWIVVGNTEEN